MEGFCGRHSRGQGLVAAVGALQMEQDTRVALLVLPPLEHGRKALLSKVANMINMGSFFYEILKNL